MSAYCLATTKYLCTGKLAIQFRVPQSSPSSPEDPSPTGTSAETWSSDWFCRNSLFDTADSATGKHAHPSRHVTRRRGNCTFCGKPWTRSAGCTSHWKTSPRSPQYTSTSARLSRRQRPSYRNTHEIGPVEERRQQGNNVGQKSRIGNNNPETPAETKQRKIASLENCALCMTR